MGWVVEGFLGEAKEIWTSEKNRIWFGFCFYWLVVSYTKIIIDYILVSPILWCTHLHRYYYILLHILTLYSYIFIDIPRYS